MECKDICVNKHVCFKCINQNLFRAPKIRKRLRARPEKHKLGIELEQKAVAYRRNMEIQSEINKVLRRQPGSGALQGAPGDIKTPEGLIECKKSYTVTAKGKKTFTIKKEWLDKIMSEAKEKCGTGSLVFQFANDDKIYIIKDYNDELADRQLLKELLEERQ